MTKSIAAGDRQHRFVRYWLPAIAWLAMIAAFSTQGFGSGNTGSALRTILHWLRVSVSDSNFEVLHYAIRKTAHFTAYGTLSALFFRALRAADPHKSIWKSRYVWISLIICFLTASVDEIHQRFTVGRTGNWHDVVLDLFGAIFVQIAILFTMSTRWAHLRWRAGAGDSKSSMAAINARLADR